MNFEWDREMAASNLEKHGVSFEEAATAFGDPLSSTILDPDSSDDEERYVLVGEAFSGRLVVVVHADRGESVGSSAQGSLREARDVPMSRNENSEEPKMRDEYDFSDGVRGK